MTTSPADLRRMMKRSGHLAPTAAARLTAAQVAALRVLAPRDDSGMYRTPHAFNAAAVACAVGSSEQGATTTLASLVRRQMVQRVPAPRMPDGRVGYLALASGVYALIAADAS